MHIRELDIPGVLLIKQDIYNDVRGFFIESYHERNYHELGLRDKFVQDNQSRSRRGTIRGLHYQYPHSQGKLVRVVRGEVFDVAVDLRRPSPTFGKWTSAWLNETNGLQLYVPRGCAHGFCVTSDLADVCYKCTNFYHADCEHVIAWNDPKLAIAWPINEPLLGIKDECGTAFENALHFHDFGVELPVAV